MQRTNYGFQCQLFACLSTTNDLQSQGYEGKKCFSLNCIFKRQDLIILIAYIDLISEGASTSLCKQSRLLGLQGALNQTIQPLNLGAEDVDL